jgi:hypothetical protein
MMEMNKPRVSATGVADTKHGALRGLMLKEKADRNQANHF